MQDSGLTVLAISRIIKALKESFNLEAKRLSSRIKNSPLILVTILEHYGDVDPAV